MGTAHGRYAFLAKKGQPVSTDFVDVPAGSILGSDEAFETAVLRHRRRELLDRFGVKAGWSAAQTLMHLHATVASHAEREAFAREAEECRTPDELLVVIVRFLDAIDHQRRRKRIRRPSVKPE